MFDLSTANIKGHITIADAETGDILVDKPNAIHFGNISTKIAEALIGKPSSFIAYMAFGNGGVTVDNTGQIIYNEPNVSNNTKVPSAQLYNTAFVYEIKNYNADNQSNATRDANTGGGIGRYEDITIVVTLTSDMPNNQMLIDIADGSNGETATNTDFVFNEIALYTGLKNKGNLTDPSDITGFLTDTSDVRPTMITHVVFHPVQKSQNRTLEITYKLRIQMGS
jgi:hypothetical protein